MVQARMGSTRLPGKVLMPIGDKSMLAHVIERTRRAGEVTEVMVATSTSPADGAIAEECGRLGVPVYRGEEVDVLSRYRNAARDFSADVIVRITADCPLVDPGIIDDVVLRLVDPAHRADYVATLGFPRGLDAEAFTAEALERAWRCDDNPAWREHVTPYIQAHPTQFRNAFVTSDEDLSAVRWTVDSQPDLDLVRAIHKHFAGRVVDWRDVLDVYHGTPAWQDINAHVEQVPVPGL